MAHPSTTPSTARLEEALIVLYCLIDDAYRLLNPDGCDAYGSLKRLADSEVLTLALLPHRAHLRAVSCPPARTRERSSIGLPPPSHLREGPLREARSGFGLRLRLPQDRRRILLGEHPQAPTRRVDRAGVMERLRRICLDAYDRLIGLELSEVAVDGCTTKTPYEGEKAGPSPVDRGKRGIKRSMAVDARGIPLGALSAPANRHDSPLLVPTLEASSGALGAPEGRWCASTAATTRFLPASVFGSWDSGGRSRGRAGRRPIGPRIGGW